MGTPTPDDRHARAAGGDGTSGTAVPSSGTGSRTRRGIVRQALFVGWLVLMVPTLVVYGTAAVEVYRAHQHYDSPVWNDNRTTRAVREGATAIATALAERDREQLLEWAEADGADTSTEAGTRATDQLLDAYGGLELTRSQWFDMTTNAWEFTVHCSATSTVTQVIPVAYHDGAWIPADLDEPYDRSSTYRLNRCPDGNGDGDDG